MRAFEYGQVRVSDEVIATIIGAAAAKVKGVTMVRGYEDATGKLRRGYAKSIQFQVEAGRIFIRLAVVFDKEASIYEAAQRVQKSVKDRVESMLGLECGRVDVVVL